MHLKLREAVTLWRHHRLGTKLNRLDAYDLELLAGWARLHADWPRRWWWIDELEGAKIIGE
jgi:hypothetical protein